MQYIVYTYVNTYNLNNFFMSGTGGFFPAEIIVDAKIGAISRYGPV